MNTTQLKAARRAYRSQKASAKGRGIEWLFTFETWLSAWVQSGRWEQRGRAVGKYVMSRPGDKGAYSPENVEIITHEVNCGDSRRNHPEGTKVVGRANALRSCGKGRGWTLLKGRQKPYQVMVSTVYVGSFATQQEAEQAYRVAADRHVSLVRGA